MLRVLLALFPALVAAAASAATFTVTKTADTADGTCDADCSLREAVIAANATAAEDTIALPAGTYAFTRTGQNEDEAATGDLDVANPLAIRGAGAAVTTIDAAGLDRAFQASPLTARLTLADVTITGGTDDGDTSGLGGGGILVTNGGLTAIRTTVRGNAAELGGGIHVLTSAFEGDAGALTILDSEIRDNVAAVHGGGIRVHGTGVFNSARVWIVRSIVDGNRSETSAGGGLSLSAGRGATIRSTTISNNRAHGSAGGLHTFSNATLVLRDVLFADNETDGTGGAVWANGPVRVEASRFERNRAIAFGAGGGLAFSTAHALSIRDSLFADNTANSYGGAIYLLTGTRADIVGTTFRGNSAGIWGGAIFTNGSAPLTIRNSTISGNSVTGFTSTGGGIRAEPQATALTRLVHTTVADNTSVAAGSQSSCDVCVGRVSVANSIVAGAGAANCAADLASEGGNVDSGATCPFNDPGDRKNADPMLAPFAANEGVTETRAIGAAGAAIGAAVEAQCEPSDQRGFARDATCDAGAFDFGAPGCAGDIETAFAWIGYQVDGIVTQPVGALTACLRAIAGI